MHAISERFGSVLNILFVFITIWAIVLGFYRPTAFAQEPFDPPVDGERDISKSETQVKGGGKPLPQKDS
jgi:hypothetical protein